MNVVHLASRLGLSVLLALPLVGCSDGGADDTGSSASSSSTTGPGGCGTTGCGEGGLGGATGSGAGGSGGAGGSAGTAGGPPIDILDALLALPGVQVAEQLSEIPGYRILDLTIEQPADHADPDGLVFQQRAQLLHTDEAAPFVLENTGYMLFGVWLDEPAQVLGANQLMLEHRFFDQSIPDPADWSLLTIEQSAADFHRVVELLQPIYSGAWIGTGISKGGMTAVYHHRFYPDDLAGTVAYVAPHSLGTSDPRYLDFVNEVGGDGAATCRQALADFQMELLVRREAMIARMEAQAPELTYDLLGLDVVFEVAVTEVPFTFWQYGSQAQCGLVPSPSASDDELWSALESIGATSFWADSQFPDFEPYFWQSAVQLGGPDFGGAHLAPLLLHPGIDVPATFVLPGPGKTPVFDPAAMLDISEWMASEGERLLFIYGERDPWTAGAFDIAGAKDAHRFVEPLGNHAASIAGLAKPDREAALAALQGWAGVVPRMQARTPGEADPARVAWLRGMRR